MAKKRVTRKNHTRTLKNGKRVKVKTHKVTVFTKAGKKRKRQLKGIVVGTQTDALRDPRTGRWKGRISAEQSKKY